MKSEWSSGWPRFSALFGLRLPASMSRSDLRRRWVIVGVGVEAFVGREQRDGRLHRAFHEVEQRQRLGGFLAGGFQARLHRGDFVGMRGGDVVLFVGILSEVVEVNAARQRGAPDELPIALPDASAERFDVVDKFRARRRFASRDGVPDVHAVERFASGGGCASQGSERGVNVHGVNDAVATWSIALRYGSATRKSPSGISMPNRS